MLNENCPFSVATFLLVVYVTNKLALDQTSIRKIRCQTATTATRLKLLPVPLHFQDPGSHFAWDEDEAHIT